MLVTDVCMHQLLRLTWWLPMYAKAGYQTLHDGYHCGHTLVTAVYTLFGGKWCIHFGFRQIHWQNFKWRFNPWSFGAIAKAVMESDWLIHYTTTPHLKTVVYMSVFINNCCVYFGFQLIRIQSSHKLHFIRSPRPRVETQHLIFNCYHQVPRKLN